MSLLYGPVAIRRGRRPCIYQQARRKYTSLSVLADCGVHVALPDSPY